jgi:hypothetical protein
MINTVIPIQTKIAVITNNNTKNVDKTVTV